MTRDWLDEARRRLLTEPRPGCWLGFVGRAIDAHEDGTWRSPAHFLVGAWAPDARGLYPRLPEFAAIASPDATRALRELFIHLPPDARVLLVDERHADAALLARMVLACDANLEPYQRAALEAFVAARELRLDAAIRETYTDREGGFERFRGRLLGEP